MEVIQLICEQLRLPTQHIRWLGSPVNSAVCLVSKEWLKNLSRETIGGGTCDDQVYLAADLCDEYLAASNDDLPLEWLRVLVRVVDKSDQLINDLPDRPLCCDLKDYSLSELLTYICQENRKNLYQNACLNLLTRQVTNEGKKRKFTDLFREIVLRFKPRHVIRIDGCQQQQHQQQQQQQQLQQQSRSSPLPSATEGSSTQPFHNVVPIHLFLELSEQFLLIQPYFPYTLWDVVSYSPSLFKESHAKSLFVQYQILQTLQYAHSRGISAGHLKLHQVNVDKKLWVNLSLPHVSFQCNLTIDKPETRSNISTSVFPYSSPKLTRSLVDDAQNFVRSCLYTVYSIDDLSNIVSDWVHRRLSNFKYLMILNHLAGRRFGDPNNHPILPWVSDFTSEHKNFRDLSKTKYRLNKGDRQLDLTYEEMPIVSGDPAHRSTYIPHHVSDVLSDITYYVYKARRTSKPILCAHVRPYWVPSEYPASITRIQQWTPDECIPEFFIDPSIFKSLHADLPDLAVPNWCRNPHDFISKHMAMLESNRVSAGLHDWIDLTFGYKLSGEASVDSKNVHLQLVDNHTNVTNCGVVQLFDHPHPQRILPPKKLYFEYETLQVSVNRDGSGSEDCFSFTEDQSCDNDYMWFGDNIPLSMDDKPLSNLEHLEALYSFSPKAVCNQPRESSTQVSSFLSPKVTVTHDMQAFGCLLGEMFLGHKTRLLGPSAPLKEQYQLIYKLCQMDISAIPRPLRQAATILLQLTEEFKPLLGDTGPVFNYIPINELGLPPPTPSLLTHQMVDIIPFPSYFPQLYDCLCHLKQIDFEIEQLQLSNDKTTAERCKLVKVLAREKVAILQAFLQKYDVVLGQEGVDLLLPYVEELLQNNETAVQAAWTLFDIMSCQLGPEVAKKKFLPQIVKLYAEEFSTPKHIKLHHHKFLVQLLVRFQLQTFLENFSTLLVEAVAGYKDFVIETDSDLPEVVEFHRQKSDFSRKVRNPIPACPEEVSEECSNSAETLTGEETLLDVPAGLETDEDAEEYEDFDENVLLGVDEKMGSERGSDTASIGRDSLKSDDIPYKQPLLGMDDDDTNSLFQNGRRFSFPVSIHDRSNRRDRSHSNSRVCSRISDRDMDEQLSASEDNASDLSPQLKLSQSEEDEEDDRVSVNAGSHNSNNNNNNNINGSNEYDNDVVIGGDEHDYVGSKTEVYQGARRSSSQKDDSPASSSGDRSSDMCTSLPSSQVPQMQMVRSETDEFRKCMEGSKWEEIVNIRDVSSDSVKWLCHRLGPLLAARYFSLNLIRLLPLCYMDEEQLLTATENTTNCRKSSQLVNGDVSAVKVLDCLSFMALLYGEQVILLQYFPAMEDMVTAAEKEMSQAAEAGLIASLVLMRHMVPLLSEKTLMDLLQDLKVHKILHSVMQLTALPICFPSGTHARSLILHKVVDVLYIVGVRIGFEMTRKHLTETMQLFFNSFYLVHCPDACPSGSHKDFLYRTQAVAGSSSKGQIREKISGSVASNDSEDSEELYWKIKIDANTEEYKIGSPVNIHELHRSSPTTAATPTSQAFRLLKSRCKRAGSSTSITSLTKSNLSDYSISPLPMNNTIDKQPEHVKQEMKNVFSPELAHAAYIPLCQIFGSIHMEQSLWNDDLIRQLCSQYDSTLDKLPSSALSESFDSSIEGVTPDLETPSDSRTIESLLAKTEDPGPHGGIGSNVAVVGNRIELQQQLGSGHPEVPAVSPGYKHTGILHIGQEDLKNPEMEVNNQRHLRGNWLAYWEHELGLSDRTAAFNFKHIKLQTFLGHNTSIRSLCVLDSESSFISASKDKTVKLWSLTSFGDGSGKCGCQWTYRLHKKSVFSVGFLESVRLVASSDSTVHIWDPFRGDCVRQLESSKNSPVIALAPIPAPSSMMITATNDSTLRFLDLRTGSYAHEYRCSPVSAGVIRSVTVSPDSNWVAVAFSSGIVSVLDIRAGTLLGQRKAHDTDILQIKACNRHTFVTSSFDQTMRLWNSSDLKEICQFKGASEPVHCIGLYRNQIISATAGNKIGVHSSIDRHATYNHTKLHPDTFKGVLASMAVLPLNRTLLLGADNGAIQLLC
ncbi:WD repeat-containing protein 81 [Octopus sinensis]|uniref:WD repeat-containing protein 81 n=1 Tax=Octopus sinensis TaxID=2607531 RepID=A0A6P7SW80_9MOLL|nr:WD repeat-containing protein 81 [Octopus sinensis]